MPIYEYQCQQCGEPHEVLQKFSDPELTNCPTCKQPTLKKLISAAGFQLKGSGWYATDFRDKATKSSENNTGTCGKSECATSNSCASSLSSD